MREDGWRTSLTRLLGAACLLAGAALALIAPATVLAATRLVAPGGVDAPGCLGSPCRHIAYAIGQAVDGDTITVAAGMYSESAIAVGKSVTIAGAGAATTTVSAGTAGRVFLLGDASKTVLISGLTITGGSITGADGGGISNTATLTLTNDRVNSNYVESYVDLTLPSLQQQVGGRGGGIFNALNATLVLNGTTISGNIAGTASNQCPTQRCAGGGMGGGIYNFGTLAVQGSSSISNNLAQNNILIASDGGGISNNGYAATARVSDSTVTGNKLLGTETQYAGTAIAAGYEHDNQGSGAITIERSVVSDNGQFAPAESGPAIYVITAPLTITESTIANNGGGAIEATELHMSDSVVQSNKSALNAFAGIRMDGRSFVTIARSTIAGNDGVLGTGAMTAGGNITITDSHIAGNTGQNHGGLNLGGTVVIANTTIVGNVTNPPAPSTVTYTPAGGGLSYLGVPDNGDTLTVTNSTISGNSTTYQGGGVWISGQATIVGSTISGNSAPTDLGGGILFYGHCSDIGAPVQVSPITNSTISGNSGGGIVDYSALCGTTNPPNNLMLVNSTVANNDKGVEHTTADGTVTLKNTLLKNMGANCVGPITTRGYNLDSGATCAFIAGGTDRINTDPKLDTLKLNAPGTTATYGLLAGSPAIDAIPAANGCNGAGVTTDQRGVARPQGNSCDIGAYELMVNPMPPPRPGGSPVTGTGPRPLPGSRPSGAVTGGPTPNPLPTGR